VTAVQLKGVMLGATPVPPLAGVNSVGADSAAAATVKPKGTACPPSGFFTSTAQAPVWLSVGDTWIADVVTELGVTNTLPPTVGVNETCRPLWNPEPLMVIAWGELFRVGVGGEIELITGRVSVVKLKIPDQLPAPLEFFP
jgi:hypothetical protein